MLAVVHGGQTGGVCLDSVQIAICYLDKKTTEFKINKPPKRQNV